jgi:hypothetical protein
MAEDKNLLDKIRDKAKVTAEGLKRQYGLGGDGIDWPQTKYQPITGGGGLNLYPNHKTRGFLPPVSLSPILDSETRFGQYTYKDWRGHLLTLGTSPLLTKDKFEEGINIPKSESDLVDSPYSTRDTYLIFGDNSTDYFKHGLHVVDRLTPIENPESGSSTLRLSNFVSTPFENNDPVIYGFDIIMDNISSPLLNGSISDFLRNYSNVSEIASRVQVYEDFKQQFIKFFKTKGTVSINESVTSITNMRSGSYPDSDNNKNIFQVGKKSYMNYYLKKVDGLEKLVEQNTPKTKKYLTKYNEDIITLSFTEDVSLSVGTLAHLYKLLYWSKANGKGIVPENLLRFNCDIIVSEVRNFNRVRKASKSGDIEVIKDNVSRYIYSLKECQFYFNNMPHEASINLGGISPYGEGSYTVQFDYKYATSKLERFMPTSNGFGQYVGYDNGAIWRIGNQDEGVEQSGVSNINSIPKFFTVGTNDLNQNGVRQPFLLSKPEDNLFKRTFVGDSSTSTEDSVDGFERFKRNAVSKAKELKGSLEDVAIRSATRELQTFINTRTAILNKTLNKILNSNGIVGVRPPRNIYTDPALNAGQRIFYDVRGDLINFVGDSIGGALGGGGISGGAFSPR